MLPMVGVVGGWKYSKEVWAHIVFMWKEKVILPFSTFLIKVTEFIVATDIYRLLLKQLRILLPSGTYYLLWHS